MNRKKHILRGERNARYNVRILSKSYKKQKTLLTYTMFQDFFWVFDGTSFS